MLENRVQRELTCDRLGSAAVASVSKPGARRARRWRRPRGALASREISGESPVLRAPRLATFATIEADRYGEP